MNIFYILGLNYTAAPNRMEYKLKPEDILLLYTDDENFNKNIYNTKNIIIIKPSVQLFGENYLAISSIPKTTRRFKTTNETSKDEDIISIFNEDIDLYIKKDFSERKIIETNIDIISDIFFMLTRYEEVVNKEAYGKERFNRFEAIESVAFKNHFLHRPIVNEHINLLWSFIDNFSLGYKRKKWWGDKDFAACLTHDVDVIQKYKKFINVIRPSASLLLKYRRPLRAIKNFISYFRGYKKDPFYTFDYIIDLEKSYGFKSSFYFMSGGTSEVDNKYDIRDKKVRELVNKIDGFDFEVGFHGSYNSYNNVKMLKEEKEKLDGIVNGKLYGCRQHFLRFQAPYTWQNQEQAGLIYDTTLSFADAEGFRCGICFPYKPYDLYKDRILDIWEIPLMVMEASLQNPDYRAYTPKQGLEETKKLIDTVKKHNGVFTMLYHNSSFDPFDKMLDGWKGTYEETMKYLYDNNCLGTSSREIIQMITK